MSSPTRIGLAVLASLWVSLSASAEVKIKVLADGTRVMYNDRPARPVWRPEAPPLTVPRSDLEALVDMHARRQRLDPELVRAVVEVESAFLPTALSNKGAMGLMQLMPETARRLAVYDPWDPNQNVRGGTVYLRRLLDEFEGQIELALAGYNAGPQSVERFGGVPPYPETRDYIERVLRIYRKEPAFALSGSPTIRAGRKAYLSRDQNGRYVLTTTPADNR